MKKPKEPVVPFERFETIRREMISLLKGQTLSSREISGMVKISEKEGSRVPGTVYLIFLIKYTVPRTARQQVRTS